MVWALIFTACYSKVERHDRIDAEEFYRMLDGVVIDDTDLFNDKPASRKTSTTSTDHTAGRWTNPLRRLRQKTTKSTPAESPAYVSRLLSAPGQTGQTVSVLTTLRDVLSMPLLRRDDSPLSERRVCHDGIPVE